MNDGAANWVPKVHPATRAAEQDDPLTLHAIPVGGDPEMMLHCVVQEYAWMGWGADDILALFRDPGYPVLGALLSWYGEEGLRERLRATLRQTGVFHYEATVSEEPDDDREEPELIQIGNRGRREPVDFEASPAPATETQAPEGSSHAKGL
jgi:hypothetical protein